MFGKQMIRSSGYNSGTIISFKTITGPFQVSLLSISVMILVEKWLKQIFKFVALNDKINITCSLQLQV